jgi:predicted anti-sigma-YlaC factor YlaD
MGFDPCSPVRPHFSDHLDGAEVPFPMSLLVRLHLAFCPPCKRLSRSLTATRGALEALRDADPGKPDTPGQRGP